MRMKLQLNTEEIQNYLTREIFDSIGLGIAVKAVGGNALLLTLDWNKVPLNHLSNGAQLFSCNRSLDVYLQLIGISENTIAFGYGCEDLGFDHVKLKVIIDYIKNNTNHSQIDFIEENKQVLIHLDAFAGLKQTLAIVKPVHMIFDKDSLEIDMALV